MKRASSLRPIASLVAALAALPSCTIEGRVPEARVALGAAMGHVPRRAVALMSMPTGAVVESAPGELERVARAVDAQVRMDLELFGWTVLDGESIRGVLRERVESARKTELAFGASGAAPTAIGLGASRVERGPDSDLAKLPAEVRAELLDALAVDSIVDVSLSAGAQRGGTAREPTLEQAITVVVAVRARAPHGEAAPVVTSACSADAGAYASFAEAADRATRCALGGVTVALDSSHRTGRSP